MNIKEIWDCLDKGEVIFCNNTSYKVYIEPIIKNNKFQLNHFSRRNNQLLTVRCISNHFGSVIDETDLSKLFKKSNYLQKLLANITYQREHKGNVDPELLAEYDQTALIK